MQIFFMASIHGKKKYEAQYRKIVELAEAGGQKLVAEHILDYTPERLAGLTEDEYLAYHKRVMEGIKRADAVFAELSYSSTSVGYLVSVAVSLGKPVVIFFSGEEEPHMFRMLEAANDKLVVMRYTDIADLDREVPMMIDFVHEAQDTRFNFFVSPTIASYLDWVAKQRRIPRSVYLRRLIDEDMTHNDDYLTRV